jgi:flagellar biosynthesis protein FliQ
MNAFQNIMKRADEINLDLIIGGILLALNLLMIFFSSVFNRIFPIGTLSHTFVPRIIILFYGPIVSIWLVINACRKGFKQKWFMRAIRGLLGVGGLGLTIFIIILIYVFSGMF